jgi:hypothetical protein
MGCEGCSEKYDKWCNRDCLASLRFRSNRVLTKDPSVKFKVCPWNRANNRAESHALKKTETEDGRTIYDAPETADIIVHH